ncbi:MAG: IS30 family transposase [Lachnospiraceae bacterium]|nr:IS30 family transposase [Lachnospiraceae bacterium]
MPKRPSGKHLSEADRCVIDQLLKEGHSIRYIAEQMECAPSTISREISNHSEKRVPRTCDCLYFKDCKRKDVCHPGRECNKLCRTCSEAKKHCPDYAISCCENSFSNRTGVCNFCSKRGICRYTRSVYDPYKAQDMADNDLRNSRKGRAVSEEHLDKIDRIVSPLLKKGQSIYHIIQTHGQELGISESTLRRMINDCDLDARNIDLRNTVQRKPRRKRQDSGYKTMKAVKEGHKYEDYLAYIAEHDVMTVQMDCVEGRKEEKPALLTLHFPDAHLQVAVIMSEQTSSEVVYALDKIEMQLGAELFAECFPVILTDNGHEFCDIEGMERSVFGGKRSMVFFCEPNRSDEKGACENNHKYMRYVIPKGTSLEPFMQKHISLMMDHVNSFKRKSLGGKSPYQLGRLLLPSDFFDLLGLVEIPPDEVNLSPALLRK